MAVRLSILCLVAGMLRRGRARRESAEGSEEPAARSMRLTDDAGCVGIIHVVHGPSPRVVHHPRPSREEMVTYDALGNSAEKPPPQPPLRPPRRASKERGESLASRIARVRRQRFMTRDSVNTHGQAHNEEWQVGTRPPTTSNMAVGTQDALSRAQERHLFQKMRIEVSGMVLSSNSPTSHRPIKVEPCIVNLSDVTLESAKPPPPPRHEQQLTWTLRDL